MNRKTQTQIIRKVKYFFYSFGIHRILPGKSFNFLGHLSQLSKWISKNKNLKYSDFPSSTFDYSRRFDLYQFLLNQETPTNEGIDYLEFGVAAGSSFKWWVKNNTHPDSKFYGFDTFTGLPEDWGPFKKGDMSNGNEPPEVNDNRAEFFQGVFQTTLYPFLKSFQSENKKVIHLDADLYSSTLFVLTTLSPFLKKGDILIFDEFNVPLHEYKAFKEWSESFYINYTVLGQVNNYYQMALQID